MADERYFGRAPNPLRRSLLVAAAGYGVVAAFVASFWTLHTWWPWLSRREMVIAAGAMAAPVALAFVWSRLTRVKIGKVEVNLSQVTRIVDTAFAVELKHIVISSAGPSFSAVMVKSINEVIARRTELLEVDLGTKPGWWSTRLFLLAALAQDFTPIQQLVFVNSADSGQVSFLGIATPAVVRRWLGQQEKFLEEAYSSYYENYSGLKARRSLPTEDTVSWIVGTFGAAFRDKKGSESEFKVDVDAVLLRQALGHDLLSEGVEWHDYPLVDHLLLYRIIEFHAEHVPLLQSRRLLGVVARDALAIQAARAALSQLLR